MGSPEESICDASPELPSLEFSKGSLNSFIIQERWLKRQLEVVQEMKKRCESYIKMEEESN